MRDDAFKVNIVIIVTALSVAKKHQFLKFEADGTILKPIGLAHLEAAITNQQVAV
jgi:DNA-binding response OmpR family regulator